MAGNSYYYLLVLVATIVLAVALGILLRTPSKAVPRRIKKPVMAGLVAPARHAMARRPVTHDDEARPLLEQGGVKPDSTVACIIQTGDGEQSDFLEGIVGSYRSAQLLRIVIQNDEPGDPRGYWRSWDVPWSDVVEVILRERATPEVHSNTLQPDGTYFRKGPYVQTRLYKVGKGIECRFLDRDERAMETGEPYRWLKAHLTDDGVRFSADTQQNSQYGDRAEGRNDALDAYTLHAKTRGERSVDEAASSGALSLAPRQIAELMAARPQKIRDYFASEEFSASLARRLANSRKALGGMAQAHADYTRRVIELAYAGAIPRRYAEMFFYKHFRTAGGGATEMTKGELAGVLRLMLQALPSLEI